MKSLAILFFLFPKFWQLTEEEHIERHLHNLPLPSCKFPPWALYSLQKSPEAIQGQSRLAPVSLQQICPQLEFSCCSDIELKIMEGQVLGAAQTFKKVIGNFISQVDSLRKIDLAALEDLYEDTREQMNKGNCPEISFGDLYKNIWKMREKTPRLKKMLEIYKLEIFKVGSSAICSLCDASDQNYYEFHQDGRPKKIYLSPGTCKKLAKVDYVYWRFAKFLKGLYSIARFYFCHKNEASEKIENLIERAIETPHQNFRNCYKEIKFIQNNRISSNCREWCQNRISPFAWEDTAHLIFISDFIYRTLSVYLQPKISDYYTNFESQRKLLEILGSQEVVIPFRVNFIIPEDNKFSKEIGELLKIEIGSRKGVDLFENPYINRN